VRLEQHRSSLTDGIIGVAFSWAIIWMGEWALKTTTAGTFGRLLMLGTAMCLCIGLRADSIVDSVNPLATPDGSFWADSSVGWFYTPTQDITVTGILTKFSFASAQPVVEQLFDGDPTNLNVLGLAAFNPTANAFSGGVFSGVDLTAGHRYFVGFQGISGFGVNVTSASGAVSLDGLGNRVAGGTGIRRFGSGIAYQFSDQSNTSPILEFQGTLTNPSTTPLPSAGWTGMVLLGVLGFLRVRTHQSAAGR
jgi:hypothetical protein